MADERRTFTREFKVEAVKLLTEQGYSVAEAARSLGISENLLRSWKTSFQGQGDQAFPGKGRLPTEGVDPRCELRQEGGGAGGDLRVHRSVLQQPAAPLVSGLRQPGGV